ncbi:hypothetical protein AERO9AM_20253 [Aeromicrobium sp. 9AM]|nr:hypothetical protein AERO9AM_20253 [Aeromicrobium sp. 9AM]
MRVFPVWDFDLDARNWSSENVGSHSHLLLTPVTKLRHDLLCRVPLSCWHPQPPLALSLSEALTQKLDRKTGGRTTRIFETALVNSTSFTRRTASGSRNR